MTTSINQSPRKTLQLRAKTGLKQMHGQKKASTTQSVALVTLTMIIQINITKVKFKTLNSDRASQRAQG